MSIKSNLWEKVLSFTSGKQPAFCGIHQFSSGCSVCSGSCTGKCDNTCLRSCADSDSNGSTNW